MKPSENWQLWLDALFDAHATFEVSLASVAGRVRLPEDWQTRQMSLPNHLLYFVMEGTFNAEFGEKQLAISAGDLLWVARGTPIQFWLPCGEKLAIQRFRLQVRDAKGETLNLPYPFLHLAPARSCAVWMDQIVEEASYAAPQAAARLRGLLACLLTEVIRLEIGSGLGASWLTRLQRETVIRYFTENIRHRPSPADLADCVALSPAYFARCFRRTFGVAPRRWMVEERQKVAALRLLESNDNISHISRELGYEDVFLFSRQFKTVFGVSPAHYRRNHGAVGRLG